MALFQNAVLQKYLKLQDAALIDKAFGKFSKYFHDRKRQANIRESKEEQFQEGFLRELFVNILGYTLNPEPNFNLTTELKNEKNAKKTDGAILKDGNALAVIELKCTRTKDLGLVQEQAFNYKANQTGCIYVITSNFEKVRFYINNAVDFEEFNLFTLSKEQFAFMYLCLHKDNLLNNVALSIKTDSIGEEEKITKTFYADYSLFKRELYRDLVKQNVKNAVFRSELEAEDSERGTKNIKLNLFKKSQKLIDRFLFVFFAEDRGLLSANSTLQILDQWQRLKDDDAYFPLYERFKIYFNYLDTGRAGTDKKGEIFAYNGGLFKPDTILDSLLINDELLYKHAKKLSGYDFDSQVDVNILGHIFENSLNEIESISAEIEGGEFDKQKTKRKKDGVFYTPKYITKYIVDNTVGKLCTEKKAELGIVEEDYIESRQKETKKKLLENLKAYREWLLQITICDPACGSGAFLNQALDFLIYEHGNIDALETSLLGGAFVFPNIENTVLENNIFGVDLNEESVEIAKLSLWLRTAQPRRKLNDLNGNIKCGNSLIDDKKVAGDKAFNWQQSFPKVFEKGGFDVIIGNPPYVQIRNDKLFFENNFETFLSGDLYPLFYEKSLKLLNVNGVLGFITPSSFMTNIGYLSLREFMLKHTLLQLIDLGANVFQDASVDSAILIMNNKVNIQNTVLIGSNLDQISSINQSIFSKLDNKILNIYINPTALKLCNKLEQKNEKFDTYIKFSRGVEFGFKSDFVKSKNEGNTLVPLLCGGNISKQMIVFENKYIQHKEDDLKIYKSKDIYQSEKILIKRIGNNIAGAYDDKGYFNVCDVYNLQLKENNYSLKSISSLINSKLLNFYYDTKFKSVKKLFPKIPIQNLKLLPIPKYIIEIDIELKEITTNYLNIISDFQKVFTNFQTYLQQKFQIEKLNTKLQNWYELDFGSFIKELNKAIQTVNKERAKEDLKAIATLSKLDEMEWMEVFEHKKAEAQALKTQINQTDKEIDQMVYELYGLTEEEIEIVEKS